MSERSPAIRALVMSRVSCGVCFACGVVNAVLITYLVSTGMYTLSATQVAWLLALPMILMVMATGCLFALLRVTRRTAQEEPSESAQRPEHRLAPGLRKPVSLSAANGVTTLEAVLQSIPFFNDLSEAHLREVIRAGRSLAMEANESVFCVDDPGDAFYVILNGDVKIYRTDSQGHEIQLETLSAGDFFGELALVDGEPRPVGAATVSSCQLFLISRRGFLTLVSKAPRVLTSLLIGLSTRIGLGFLLRFERALEKEKMQVQMKTMETERHLSIAQMHTGVAHELRKPVSLSVANEVATLEAALQNIPFFNDLSEEQLGEVIRAGRSLSMEANESVFRVGDAGDAFYAILNGDVRIYRTDSQGHEIQLETLSAGGFFGELALIDGEPRSTGASTISSCQLFLLSRQGFLTLVSKAPRVLTSLLIGLSTRIGRGFLRRFELALEKEKMQVQMETMETERHLSIAHMVTGVAHELNTPLGIVNHAASMLIDALSPEAIPALAEDEHVQGVLSDIREASMLILNNLARADGLLQTFKCLSVKQMAERKEDVDIGTLTEESVDVYKMLTQESQLDLEVIDELGDLNRRWEGYPGHFSQILLNLLTNIERYAYPQDRGGKVQIMVSRDDSESIEPRFSVVVQDFGCGIPETELPKVFDAFYTTGRSQGGTGLGLAIVHNLVTSSLQGTIHIESAPGEGTRVLISLPHIVTGKPGGVESDKIPTDLVIKL